MNAAIFDYGAGNLHSLAKALESAGARVAIEPDPVRAAGAELLVLPGVGAFAAAAERLEPGRERMREALAQGLPCLAVCLGMQLLFEGSEEGPGRGLALLAGQVTRLDARRVPHIGWNRLDEVRDPRVAEAGLGIAYFANGYACRPRDPSCVTVWTRHEGDRFAAAVRVHSVLGVQFHPEKSSRQGLALVRAFVREAERGGRVAAGAPPGAREPRP